MNTEKSDWQKSIERAIEVSELFWANFKPGDDVEFVEVTSDHARR